MVLPVVGVGIAVTQVVRGVVAEPTAIQERLKGREWDQVKLPCLSQHAPRALHADGISALTQLAPPRLMCSHSCPCLLFFLSHLSPHFSFHIPPAYGLVMAVRTNPAPATLGHSPLEACASPIYITWCWKLAPMQLCVACRTQHARSSMGHCCERQFFNYNIVAHAS